jgi:ubiquinone/menaquinone biosynthesis C-methylase UbiE
MTGTIHQTAPKLGNNELRGGPASLADKVHFRMMSLVHETLYSVFRDPYKVLDAAGLRPGQKVLEVGCGPGFFTVPAATIVGETGGLYTLDISPLAIDKVQQKINKAGATNVTPILADAARTGLPDQSLDLIFVFGFSHYGRHMDGILAELHRLLKPGGILATEGQLWFASELFRPLERQGRIIQFVKA